MKSHVAEKILEEAEQQVQEIQEELVHKERELAETHQREKNRRKEQLYAEIEERVATEMNRVLAMAGLEMKKERLQAKTEILEQVLARCKTTIRNDRDLYLKFLKAMVVRGALSGHEEVLLSEEDLHVLGPEILMELNHALEEHHGRAGHLKLAALPEDPGGGLILKDGPISFNATLDQAIQTVSENTRVALVKLLFQEVHYPFVNIAYSHPCEGQL